MSEPDVGQDLSVTSSQWIRGSIDWRLRLSNSERDCGSDVSTNISTIYIDFPKKENKEICKFNRIVADFYEMKAVLNLQGYNIRNCNRSIMIFFHQCAKKSLIKFIHSKQNCAKAASLLNA